MTDRLRLEARATPQVAVAAGTMTASGPTLAESAMRASADTTAVEWIPAAGGA